jgi:putative OPT family oligopeptide transporter
MMFSVPAIFILGYGGDFNRAVMVLGCIAGGILGVAFIIPLRKQMIDYNRLAYPGGIATAAVLRSPGAGVRKAQMLLVAALVSGGIHAVSLATGVEVWNLGAAIGMPEYMNGIWYLSLLTIGTGYLAGRGGFFFVVGGFVCYWILAPLLSARGMLPSPEVLQGANVAEWLRVNLFRPVGIGMLVGGALTGILFALPLVRSAVRSMQSAAQTRTKISADELPIRLLYRAVAGAFVLLMVIAIIASPEMDLLRGVAMAVLGTLWIWMAGVVLAECIGRTNWSPLSGMTLIGVTILIFVASGFGVLEAMSDKATVVASVMVGAAMCVAMSQATDLMMDLKTGYMVGAVPRKQQLAQFIGVWLGPIVIMGLILVLHESYTLGSDALPAPQGQALASIVQGILGGDVPVQKYAGGALIGALLSSSGVGGLGVLVGLGFYLPFNIVLTYSIGTLLRIASDARLGVRFADDAGIPIAAGLIVGEALVGVVVSLLKVMG